MALGAAPLVEGVAVADAEALTVAVAVAGGLLLRVAVDAGLRLRDADLDAVALRVLVAAAVPDALAPRARLPVGVYDACGQKHMGNMP